MIVRIVTDSGADLPGEIVKNLDITVVPLHILFGTEDYRDGVDIGHEELYRRLVESPVMPTTSTASPGEFANVFRKLIQEGAEGIICINISGKLSKTYGSAVLAQKDLEKVGAGVCPITVIDSENATMATGLLVIMAARLAQEGKNQTEIVRAVKENISRVHMIGALDILKYLIKGGRAPKIAVVSDILKLKTFIKINKGEVHVAGRARTQREKISHLMNFVESFADFEVEEVAVEYSTNQEEAEILIQEIGGRFPEAHIYCDVLGAVLGVHAGPGFIAVSVKTKM